MGQPVLETEASGSRLQGCVASNEDRHIPQNSMHTCPYCNGPDCAFPAIAGSLDENNTESQTLHSERTHELIRFAGFMQQFYNGDDSEGDDSNCTESDDDDDDSDGDDQMDQDESEHNSSDDEGGAETTENSSDTDCPGVEGDESFEDSSGDCDDDGDEMEADMNQFLRSTPLPVGNIFESPAFIDPLTTSSDGDDSSGSDDDDSSDDEMQSGHQDDSDDESTDDSDCSDDEEGSDSNEESDGQQDGLDAFDPSVTVVYRRQNQTIVQRLHDWMNTMEDKPLQSYSAADNCMDIDRYNSAAARRSFDRYLSGLRRIDFSNSIL